jgi:hypothetical protein
MADADRIEIPRSAKGKRPQYFDDPASDKLHFMIMALIEELSVSVKTQPSILKRWSRLSLNRLAVVMLWRRGCPPNYRFLAFLRVSTHPEETIFTPEQQKKRCKSGQND